MMHKEDDASLTLADTALADAMVEYQHGSLDAFDRVHAALARPLYVYLVSLVRDPSAAQDLVQETFLQVHRSRRTYRPDHRVQPWAFGIAHHVFLMHRRATGRRLRRETEQTDQDAFTRVTSGAQDALIARDQLQRALRDVSPDRRQALILHHLLGFRFSEIARRLGIRPGAAKVRASRGIAALRAILTRHQEPDK
jgi:RNA polymerase sigma-70 factor (ECF subfamily)